MTNLQRLRNLSIIKCITFFCSENKLRLSKSNFYVAGSYPIVENLRFYGTSNVVRSQKGKIIDNTLQIPRAVRQEAQAALLDYLHSTRSLQFMDAENMSRNSPYFLGKLLKRLDNGETDVGRSVTRLLRYHPINEFEPFFESIGLKPSEYSPFLPQNLMFLNDDQVLLKNYYVLCNYGIERNKVGKIYKEAPEVFKYDCGVLQSKLQSFEKLGLSQSLIIKVIASCPYLLRGDMSWEFIEVLRKLKNTGIEYNWLEEHMFEGNSYSWNRMLELLCMLSDMGCSEEQLGGFISRHPELLLERSGHLTYFLIGFLLKFGYTRNELSTMFLQLPKISAENFATNLLHSYHFLVEIEMTVQDIGRIVHSHPVLLGSCYLKKVNSLLANLNTGKKRLCQMIMEDPNVLKNWVLGVRVKRLLPDTNKTIRARMMKTEFLLSLGFMEKSNEMERALKVFRGKGIELQERFDCLVNAGLKREEVIKMLKSSPHILNQSKDVIESKIDYLVNELGYPVSSLIPFPSYISYTIDRVKLRLSLYKWLVDEKAADKNLALSTLLACSEKKFDRTYVNCHPRGPEVWEKLRKEM
ncbi:transcription termination factor MTEF18, mitochondrial-like isoform X1 [Olea europaea var. sylvestris]|uniref:transcription termination factor MTEF18, mitochondrial-like isoform X1 n=2 Tax=Olea europaea var. sylvestris TaxID=158386 RepID=UPI000C1CF232|nr:transcription termination factor MTEF18, mitochondrial-like isoform X1 [Olea europaea var. sylvestris]